jgi:hypothetical protein
VHTLKKVVFWVPSLKLPVDLLDEPVDLDAIKQVPRLYECIHIIKDVDLVEKREHYVF